jgi:uncharacterized membrane protein
MLFLVLGLALFLGAHSVRIFADGWRTGLIASRGAGVWKGLHTLVSLTGLVLIIFGYGQARAGAPLLPGMTGMTYVTVSLVGLGFICVIAAYWPRNHIQKLLGDPMVFGVGLWALGHLLVKTTPAALVLFGAFLVWALLDYISLRSRAGTASNASAPAKVLNTVLVIVVGSVLSAVFVLLLHKLLFGVAPLG